MSSGRSRSGEAAKRVRGLAERGDAMCREIFRVQAHALGLFFDRWSTPSIPTRSSSAAAPSRRPQEFQHWFLAEIRAGMPVQRRRAGGHPDSRHAQRRHRRRQGRRDRGAARRRGRPLRAETTAHSMRLLVISALVLIAAGGAFAQLPAANSEQDRIAAWRKSRLTELTADDGWLTLVGLHWLHDGENHAGSAAGTDLPLPPTAPPSLGTFTLVGGRVTFAASEGGAVTVDGKSFTSGELVLDKTVLASGSLRMLVIQRGPRVGLRVRDLGQPRTSGIPGVEAFPIRRRRPRGGAVRAVQSTEAIPIVNVLGDVIDTPSPGRLIFRLHDAEYALDALIDDPAEPDLFVIFRDRTNGSSTYPAGRYLHVPLPVGGKTTIDSTRPTTRPARSPRSRRARCRRSRTGSRRRLKRGRRTITCTDRAGCLVPGALVPSAVLRLCGAVLGASCGATVHRDGCDSRR